MGIHVNIDNEYKDLLNDLALSLGYSQMREGLMTGNLGGFLKALANKEITVNQKLPNLRIPASGKLLKVKFVVLRWLRGTIAKLTMCVGQSGANIIQINVDLPPSDSRHSNIYILMTYPTKKTLNQMINDLGDIYVKADMEYVKKGKKEVEINSKTEIYKALDNKHYERDIKASYRLDHEEKRNFFMRSYDLEPDQRLIKSVACVFTLQVSASDRECLVGDISQIVAEYIFYTQSVNLSYKDETVSIEMLISFTVNFDRLNLDIEEQQKKMLGRIKKIQSVKSAKISGVNSLN